MDDMKQTKCQKVSSYYTNTCTGTLRHSSVARRRWACQQILQTSIKYISYKNWLHIDTQTDRRNRLHY